MTTLLQKKYSCQLPKSKWTDSKDITQLKLLGWGSHRYSSVKGLTLSCSLCNKGKKHNTNEWETGNGLNPCLATLMSACEQSLSNREPLSAVTTRLRDAFFLAGVPFASEQPDNGCWQNESSPWYGWLPVNKEMKTVWFKSQLGEIL